MRYFLFLNSVLSFFLAMGIYRRWIAIFLAYIFAAIVDMVPIGGLSISSIAFFILLAMAFVPSGEPFSMIPRYRFQKWRLPSMVYIFITGVFAIYIFLFGLQSFFTNRGEAQFPWFQSLPYVFYLPLLAWKKTRLFSWYALCFLLVFFPPPVYGVLTWFLLLSVHFFCLHFSNSPEKPTEKSTEKPTDRQTVYIDSSCVLCCSFARFIIEEDSERQIQIDSLQNQTSAINLAKEVEFVSVVFKKGEDTYSHSTAVLKILNSLGGIWSIMGSILLWIPKSWRDYLYTVVERNRHRFFGKQETSSLPCPLGK